MPTGYTSAVQDGKVTTIAEFMRHCAPNFILDLRDAPRDAPIPRASKCQADGLRWEKERIEGVLSEIHRLHGLSPADADAEALAAFNAETDRITRRRAERETSRTRYEAMLTKIDAWAPHERLLPLRSFMIEQLHESIRFDCTGYEFDVPPQRQTGAEWLAASIAELQREHARLVEKLPEAEARKKNWDEYYGLFCDEIAALEATSPS